MGQQDLGIGHLCLLGFAHWTGCPLPSLQEEVYSKDGVTVWVDVHSPLDFGTIYHFIPLLKLSRVDAMVNGGFAVENIVAVSPVVTDNFISTEVESWILACLI